MSNHKQVAWKCRRGMLELDIVLNRFFEQQYDQLPFDQQQGFIRLLDQPDPILAKWLFGIDQPQDPEFIQLIALIK
ncbi:MAG: succinate dehydrogenase assembly factor 2 [Proteobacteria bacterium]|nr:succinate dehydrogenase assembly factor 2 [Pseudomonadota bacterium]